MVKLMIRWGIVLGLLLSGLVGLVCGAVGLHRTLTPDVHALIAPPNCAPPCFIGIHPGETHIHQAVGRLAASDWIATADVNGVTADSGYIVMTWSGAQPAWIDSREPGRLIIEQDLVLYIGMMTRIPVGALWSELGTPDASPVTVYQAARGARFWHTNYYHQHGFIASVTGSCPLTDVWHAPVYIELVASSFDPDEIGIEGLTQQRDVSLNAIYSECRAAWR